MSSDRVWGGFRLTCPAQHVDLHAKASFLGVRMRVSNNGIKLVA